MNNHIRQLVTLPLLSVVLFLTGCNFSLNRQPEPIAQDLALPALQTPVVERVTYRVERGDVVQTVEFDGSINLSVEEDLFFGSSGRVRKVHVQSGDFVEQGDLIAELDTRDFDFALQQAQLDYDLAQQRLVEGAAALDYMRQRAELDLQIAELRLEAYQDREDPNPQEVSIRERQLEQAQLLVDRINDGSVINSSSLGANVDLQRLETDVVRAELALQQAAARLSDAQIVAPFAGEVQLYPELDEGEGAAAYEPVVRLVEPNSYEITASLVREDMEQLYEGMPVTVGVSGGSTRLDGAIATLPQPFGRGVEPVTIIELNDPEALTQFRPGATLEIVAQLDVQEATLWLPADAVRGFGDNRFVLVEEANGGIRETPVTIGVSNSDQVEIVDGAFEGMMVIAQ